MPLKYTANNGNLQLALGGELTIFQAAERKPELLHMLSHVQHTLSLDLSAVDEIDTAGVQLLLLLQREIRRSGRAIEVSAFSPAALAVFDLLQLHEMFGADSAPQAEAAA
ncbi:STAS domain-containing protein [Herbaspirillum sp. LeCh32-8]|uniref:STAS domain-containing protein n=1 Tax=Herbaspirillum sp. LeCh32-8 TaxID=2821356 RepID=UPI001AE25853|nr:STAS domain-containing protein [Herbaspirillum sp. LeCh32-8]MBP0600324.1 STAS domain-containing protein [Herbaspirillum sp. LeCh32-8]